MVHSLRALLTGIIDYAGLFPPAQLPLDQAFRNYVRYQQEPESWMMARFVCPAASLSSLEGLPALSSFAVSVLGRGGNTPSEFIASVKADMESLASFVEQLGEKVTADAFEVRLPENVVETDRDQGLGACISAASVIMDTRLAQLAREYYPKPVVLVPYYEAAPAPDWRAATSEAITGVASDLKPFAPGAHVHCRPAGFKLRCGGVEARAFPAPEKIAFTIAHCLDAGIPMKFTAGLHHPIRHYDTGVQTRMHGFINVFAAGALTHARGLSADQLLPIIEDEDGSHFIFTDEGLRWNDYFATTEEISAARQNFVTSFGSCSFDEPRDDLRALGWL